MINQIWNPEVFRSKGFNFFPSAVVFAKTYFTFLPSRAANRQIHSEYFSHSLIKQIEILPLYLQKETVQSVLKTLDLLCVNNSSLVNRVETMPPIGQSDHDITFIEINQSLTKNKQQPHKIHIFKKANWDQIEQYKQLPLKQTKTA